MNEKIDLTKILKDCPKGTKLYSTIYGDVEFNCLDADSDYPIFFRIIRYGDTEMIAEDGRLNKNYDGECTLFPSKDQRDWSKWKCPKPKFDPKTLQPFDKVLILDTYDVWQIELFSHIRGMKTDLWYQCLNDYYSICIPYNNDTKHLVGTTEEAPEYYRYWED